MQMSEDELRFDPDLPPGWRSLRVNLTCRGRHLMVKIWGEPREIEIAMRRAGAPIDVAVGTIDGCVSWNRPLAARCETGVWVLKDSKL